MLNKTLKAVTCVIEQDTFCNFLVTQEISSSIMCMTLIDNYTVSAKTLKAMPAPGPAKSFKLQVLQQCKSIAGLNSRNQCNSHKLLPVQQNLQMLQLPVHHLYCQPGAEDLQISRKLILSKSQDITSVNVMGHPTPRWMGWGVISLNFNLIFNHKTYF